MDDSARNPSAVNSTLAHRRTVSEQGPIVSPRYVWLPAQRFETIEDPINRVNFVIGTLATVRIFKNY